MVRGMIVASTSPRLLTPSSYATLLTPIIVLVIPIALHNRVLLDYTHVICGGTWTGIDLFMGLVMSRIMRGLTPETSSD